MGRSYQRNNSTIINEDTWEPPTSALKYATNSQIRTNCTNILPTNIEIAHDFMLYLKYTTTPLCSW